MRKLVIDSNIFIHYLPLSQFNWLEVVGTNEVIFVFTNVLLKELDKLKRSTTSRINKRAKEALNEIDTAIESGAWKNGIPVEFVREIPNSSIYEEYELDKGEQDDKIIATTLNYIRTYPSVDILILTGDTSCRRRSQQYGLSAITPNKYELPVEEDEVQKENNKLKSELQKLKSALPKIDLTFLEGNKFIDLTFPEVDWELFKNESMVNLRQAHLKYNQSSTDPFYNISSFTSGVSAMEADRYNKEVDEYLKLMEEYIETNKQYFIADALTSQLSFLLINTGTVPAKELEICLYFPPEFHVMELDEEIKYPSQPEPPLTPNTKRFDPVISGVRYNQIHAIHRDEMDGEPDIAFNPKDGGQVLKYKFESFKHGPGIGLEAVKLSVWDDQKLGNFSIRYTVSAANIPTFTEGKLNVIVHREDKI